MERLMAVRVRPDGTVDPNDSADQIPGQGVTDLAVSRVHEIFGSWWESANRVAGDEVKKRAEKWMNEIRGQHLAEHSGLRDRFKIWADATRKAILGEYDDPTTFLPGIERDLPPTVKRRLREHRKEVDEHESFLNLRGRRGRSAPGIRTRACSCSDRLYRTRRPPRRRAARSTSQVFTLVVA